MAMVNNNRRPLDLGEMTGMDRQMHILSIRDNRLGERRQFATTLPEGVSRNGAQVHVDLAVSRLLDENITDHRVMIELVNRSLETVNSVNGMGQQRDTEDLETSFGRCLESEVSLVITRSRHDRAIEQARVRNIRQAN